MRSALQFCDGVIEADAVYSTKQAIFIVEADAYDEEATLERIANAGFGVTVGRRADAIDLGYRPPPERSN